MSVINGGLDPQRGIFTYAGLAADPGIQRQFIERKWGLTKLHAPFVSFLNLLGTKGRFGGIRSIASKKIEWGIGDYIGTVSTLQADAQLDVATSSAGAYTSSINGTDQVVLPDQSFVKYDVLLINDTAPTIAHTVTAGDDNWVLEPLSTQWITVRLTSGPVASGGNYVYTCQYLGGAYDGMTHTYTDSDNFDSGTIIFETATATVIRLASATNYDDAAREYLNVKPTLMSNVMQRPRDTVGEGIWEETENTLADHSLAHQTLLSVRRYAELLDKALLFNPRAIQAGPGENDYGVFGGLDYFINPKAATSSDYVANTDYVGTNYVVANTLTLDDFIDWASEIGRYGERDKVLVCGSSMGSSIHKMLRAEVGIERESYHDLDVGIPDYWAMEKFSAGMCNFYVMIDPNLDGIAKAVTGNVSGASVIENSTQYFAYGIDMSQIAVIYFDAMGRGVQSPHTASIDATDNNTIRRVEQDATLTLAIGDPRACGIIAFTGKYA